MSKERMKLPTFSPPSSDEDEQQADKWNVQSQVLQHQQISIKYQKSNLVNILINLYGSQEAFIA